MKAIKFLITLFFLVASYWVVYLVFQRHFVSSGMSFAVENNTENTFMILIVSTALSVVGIFCMGLLSLFVNFVFVKLVFSDEIREAARHMLINKRKENKDLVEFRQRHDELMCERDSDFVRDAKSFLFRNRLFNKYKAKLNVKESTQDSKD
jgi:hypothetical protein